MMVKCAVSYSRVTRPLTGIHSHMGPFVFTMTLLPLCARTAAETGSDVRIVNVRMRSSFVSVPIYATLTYA